MTLEKILDELRENTELLREKESSSLPLIIKQGQLLVQLRRKARRDWERTCDRKLGIDVRVAQRFLRIGQQWPDEARTPDADLLAKLPSDLHKLEALAQLPLEKLRTLAGRYDLRKAERNDVIALVKEQFGTKPEKKKKADADPVTAVYDHWDTFGEQLVKDVKKLDAAGRQEVVADLDGLFHELHDRLKLEVPPSPQGGVELGAQRTEEPQQPGEGQDEDEADGTDEGQAEDGGAGEEAAEGEEAEGEEAEGEEAEGEEAEGEEAEGEEAEGEEAEGEEAEGEEAEPEPAQAKEKPPRPPKGEKQAAARKAGRQRGKAQPV